MSSEAESEAVVLEDVHWSEAKYFWGPVCGAAALFVIFVIVMIELFRCRRKAAAAEAGDEEAEAEAPAAEEAEEEAPAEELVAVAVEAAPVQAAAPVKLVESAAVKADLGSMERIVHGEKTDTMTLGIGSMGGSLDEYDDLMDDEAIWNEDGSFVVKPKYQVGAGG